VHVSVKNLINYPIMEKKFYDLFLSEVGSGEEELFPRSTSSGPAH